MKIYPDPAPSCGDLVVNADESFIGMITKVQDNKCYYRWVKISTGYIATSHGYIASCFKIIWSSNQGNT